MSLSLLSAAYSTQLFRLSRKGTLEKFGKSWPGAMGGVLASSTRITSFSNSSGVLSKIALTVRSRYSCSLYAARMMLMLLSRPPCAPSVDVDTTPSDDDENGAARNALLPTQETALARSCVRRIQWRSWSSILVNRRYGSCARVSRCHCNIVVRPR